MCARTFFFPELTWTWSSFLKFGKSWFHSSINNTNECHILLYLCFETIFVGKQHCITINLYNLNSMHVSIFRYWLTEEHGTKTAQNHSTVKWQMFSILGPSRSWSFTLPSSILPHNKQHRPAMWWSLVQPMPGSLLRAALAWPKTHHFSVYIYIYI